ncbi:unnamed protein product, partial [marine sediment metagenome]
KRFLKPIRDATWLIDTHINQFEDAKVGEYNNMGLSVLLCERYSIELARKLSRTGEKAEVMNSQGQNFVYLPDRRIIIDVFPEGGGYEIARYARERGLYFILLHVDNDADTVKQLYPDFKPAGELDHEFKIRQKKAIELAEQIEKIETDTSAQARIANLIPKASKYSWVNWLIRIPFIPAILAHELAHYIYAKINRIVLESVNLLSDVTPKIEKDRGPPPSGFYLAGPITNFIFASLSLISLH